MRVGVDVSRQNFIAATVEPRHVFRARDSHLRDGAAVDQDGASRILGFEIKGGRRHQRHDSRRSIHFDHRGGLVGIRPTLMARAAAESFMGSV